MSLALDVRGLDDRSPPGNFTLHQRGERLLASCGLGGYVATNAEQAPAHARVIQCLINSIAELVANCLRRALRRK